MSSSLILTVTRACNHRCDYCPTTKEGWPALGVTDAVRALELFVARYGGGDVKLFGGEPLLEPEVVRAVFEEARQHQTIRRVILSTNGLALSDEWLDYLGDHPQSLLTVSLDGRPADHRKHRQPLPGVADAYDHLYSLVPRLVGAPRTVVTQTIAPSAAAAAEHNYAHLRSLGFTRYNFLPCYYVPWSTDQLADLRRSLAAIGARIEARWAGERPLYLKNLFTWAPTPLFNTGMVVDTDGSIHASNVALASSAAELWDQTRAGSLDEPPTRAELDAKAETIAGLLPAVLPTEMWQSTQAVDAELSRFCRALYPAYAAYRTRARRRAVA